MALPVTIHSGSAQFPNQNYYCGPFKSSGGAYYAVLKSSTTNIRVYKATDPTDSWGTGVDTGDEPTNLSLLMHWAFPAGDTNHIVYLKIGTLRHVTFDMSTDQWGSDTEAVGSVSTNGNTSHSCSIAVRSDGDIIVLYNGNTEREMGTDYDRVYYAREEGAGWTVDVKVDNSDAGGAEDDKHWFGSVVIKGSSDRMHFFLRAADSAYQRTLTSGNSLETFPSAGDTGLRAVCNHIFAPGISYDDSGTQRVRCPFHDANAQISYAEFDSADAPGAFTSNVDVSDNDADRVNNSPIACTAADGTDEYLVYSGGAEFGADNDLYYDKNDGTDVEHRDGVTINRVSCNVYDRSGTKLAMVYDDGGTIKYDEVSLAAPPAGPLVGSLALMGVGK